MDTLTLCGWSAFQWHRIPPLVKMLHLADGGDDARLDELLAMGKAGDPLFGGVDWPLHAHARDADHKPRRGDLLVPRLCGSVTPRDPRVEPVGHGFFAMNPLLTMLTLASQLSPERLALAGCELCGTFSIFKPDPGLQAELDAIRDGNVAHLGDLAEDLLVEARLGWQQARDINGRPSDLWKRPPQLAIHEIHDFISGLPDRARGKKNLLKAIDLMVERTASPLEATAALLLGQPRRRGGENLGTPLCNHPIPLGSAARQIAGQTICHGDLCFQGRNGVMLDIECHSKAWHDSSEKAMSDMQRATALECMGVDVLFITSDQLRDDSQAAEFAQLARRKLGIKQADPTVGLLRKRDELRKQVLVDWKTFGIGF